MAELTPEQEKLKTLAQVRLRLKEKNKEKPDPGGLASRGIIGAADAGFSVLRQGAGLLGAGVMASTGALAGKSTEEISEVALKTLELVGGEPFTQAGEETLDVIGGGINKAGSMPVEVAAKLQGSEAAERIGKVSEEEGFAEGLAELGEPLGPFAQTLLKVAPEVAATLFGGRLGKSGPRTLPPDPIQAGRAAEFAEVGVTPTRANITRSADDFTKQQDLLKESPDNVRRAVSQQDQALASRFDEAVTGTGGQPGTSTVSDAVIGRSVRLDDEIGALYREARELSGDGPVVDLTRFNNRVLELQASDRAMQGLPSSIKGDLEALGVVDARGNVVRGVSFAEAEEIRIGINSHFGNTQGKGRIGMKDLKDALDDDVLRTGGADVFNRARTAKRDFEQGLEKAKISKFDNQKTNLVRDVLESKVNAETLVDDVIFKSKYKARDLRQLRDYLTQDADGVQAWNDLRSQVFEEIKLRSFQGPELADGIQSISRAKLDRALTKIGRDRLQVIMEPKELGLLDAIMKVTELREPLAGTALGSGPTGKAVQDLNRRIEQVPVIGSIVHLLRIDRNGRIAIDGVVRPQVVNPLSPAAIPAAGVLPATEPEN